MQTQPITLNATLTTTRILQVKMAYLFTDSSGHKIQEYELEDDFDFSNHERVMEIILQDAEENEIQGGIQCKFDAPSLRTTIYGYQVVERTNIIDDRQHWNHASQSSTMTSRKFSPLIVIRGRLVQRKTIQALLDWVRDQKRMQSGLRAPEKIWKKKGVDIYSIHHLQTILDSHQGNWFVNLDGKEAYIGIERRASFKLYRVKKHA